MKLKQFIFALVAMLLSFVSPAFAQVAKVGNTEYKTIDEAIDAWTNNTTLTLLSDVTLSDVVTLKSTEHHILDLSTYTMTAASGKNAIVIQACGTGDSERTAITIKADATNPGGINAGSKCVVYYKYADGGISGNDRPIIKIEGGVFTGSTSSFGTAGIYTVGTAARKCATLNISGGTFNCSINGSGKSKLIISGGVFNYSVGSQGDSTALRLISGGKFKTLGFMTADNNNTKFWFGTSMANSNVGLYVDDEGYLCVGGPVITELSPKYKAVASNATKWSSYLAYSSAATNGLYYTNAEAAIKKHGAANVTVFEPVKAPAVEEVVKPEATEEEKAVVEDVIEEVTNNAAVENYTVELPDEVTNFTIELAKVEVAEGTTPEAPETPATVVTEISYTVTPSNAAGEKVSKPSESITFRLPVPSNFASEKAKVIYNGNALPGNYEVKTGNGAKYVEVESQSFSTYTVKAVVPLESYVQFPAGMDASNYETMFGTNTVTDGTNYYATLQTAVEAVAGQANAVLYCKPGADVGSLQHAPVVSTLTIYGNGANVTGVSERDFDLGNTDPSAGKDITADMTLTVKHLNGCGAWGAKATSHTVNLVFENCANMGKVFITGTTGTLNITMNDCAFEGVIKEAVYSNADGAITLNNVAFSNLNKAINLNHKAAGTQTVTINGCSFTNCGADVAADQIPVRVLSSVDGGKSVLNVSNTTFTGTPANGADILLDYGVGETTASVTATAANVFVEKENNVATQTTVTADQNNVEFTNTLPEATLNGQEYATLAEAITAAQNGETITLIDNVVLAERVTIPADKTLTIDLNGKSISMEESIITTAYAINNLGNLTITDGVGGGSINARGIYNGYGDGGANVATATITVLGGTFNAKGTNGGAAIFNYGTANVNGGKFTSIGGYSLNNQAGASMIIADGVTANNGIYASNATLVVNGGEINGNRSGCHVLYAWNSVVTINGGTFYNYNSGNSTIMAAGTTKLTIKDGTFGIKDGRVPGDGNTWTSCLTDTQNSAEMTVNGGTFNGGFRVQTGTSMTINGGSFNDVYGSNYNIYGTVTVTGGTFTDDAAKNFATSNLAGGYELNADGTVAAKPVAEVNGVKYASFTEAAAAANAGDEIVMHADATVEGTLALPAGIKLKSNGHTITGSIRMLGDLELNGPLTITGGLWVGKSGETLTATLSGDKLTANYFMFQRGTYTIDADIDAVYGYLSYEGTFEVNSTIHTTGANGEVLYINGNVTLNDGAVLDSDNSVFVCNDNAVLTLKPGSKVESNVSITTSGAKLYIDATGMTAGASANITGTVTNSGNGTIAVVGNDKLEAKIVDGKVVLAAKPAAKIGEQGYATLYDAVKVAKVGDKITLLDDADLAFTDDPMYNNIYASEIDLNGKTLTIKEGDLRFDNVTIKNGNIIVQPGTYNGTAIFLMYSKNLTFDGVKVTATGVASTYLIGLEKDGDNPTSNLTLNNSEIVINNESLVNISSIIADNGNGNTVTIKDSKIEITNSNARLYLGGTNGNITVENSDIDLNGVKEGFYLRAGQTLAITGTSTVDITLNTNEGRYGINLTDITATYTKAETATVNATLKEVTPAAVIGTQKFATLQAAIDAAILMTGDVTIEIMSGTYAQDINLTNAAVTVGDANARPNITFKPAAGADVTLAGTTTLGYRLQNVGASMWQGEVIFEGIKFNHAENGKHSLDIQDVKGITLLNCTVTGDGEYGIGSNGSNATPKAAFTNCTFENGAMQVLGQLSANLVIDGCTFDEFSVNAQGGAKPGLTIKNSTFNLTLTDAHVGESFYAVRSNANPINIQNTKVTVDSELSSVAADQAKWGLFWARKDGKDVQWNVASCEVNLTDAAMAQTELPLTKNDGTANAFQRIILTDLTSTSNNVADLIKRTEGCATVNGINYKDGERDFTGLVAKIGDEYYATLQAAIEAVQEGETIILVDNVNVTTPAYGQNALNHARAINFTLDLNGKTLSANTGNSVFRFNIANSGATSDVTLTIKNGTIVAGSNTWCAVMASGISADVKAIMNLENLTIESSKANDMAVKSWSNATINAKNVTVNATNAAGGFYAVGGEIVLDECTVNQKGLYTSPYMSMAFAVSSNGKMTINSGTYSAEPTAAAEGSNQGSTHGSWVGGVMNSGGELIINGGTFSNGNFGDDALATAARGLIFADTNGKVTVNGGTFNALKSIFDFQNNLAGTSPVITVKGGNYSADPAVVTSYGSIVLDANCVVVENNGVWNVVKAAAKIGEQGYATLQAAFNAVQDGETITLVDNVTISAATAGYTDGTYTDGVRYTGDKSFTVDFNGKTVTDDGCVNDYLIYINNKGEKASEITFTNGTIVSANGCWSAVCVNSSAATQNVELNLNGMNITNSNDAVYSGNPVVRVRTLATVNVNDGTIITSNGASYGVTANTDGSTVNINEGATIVQQNSGTTGGNSVFAAVGGKGVINIKGGTITSDRYGVHTMTTGTPVINISGGTITAPVALKSSTNGGNGELATINVTGGTINGTLETYTDNGKIVVSGGTFSEAVAEEYCADGFVPAENADGTFGVEKAPVASINGTKYTSLAEAVAAAQAGDEIVLTADVKTTDGVVITDKNLTIDLNGKTYTVTEGANANNRNFKINGTSVVTVKNGTMVAAGEYSSGAYGTIRTEGTANVTLTGLKLYNYRGNGLNIKACAGTTVTVENTEIYANYGGGIEAAGGTIVINDGVTVKQEGMYTAPYNSMAISVNGGGKVTVNGGTFSTECITAEEANNQGTSHGPWVAGVLNSGGTLIINGGTFSNDNFGENSLATAARGAILADTKAKVEINGGTFNVLKNVIDIQNNLSDTNNNPSVLLVGGTYSADPRISAQYGSNLITLAEDYIAVENNGVWNVVKAVAKIGEQGYETLEAALAAQGNEVELLSTYEVAAGETKTLDLKGKTVIGTPVEAKAYAVIINKGNLTITGNGSVICNHTLAGSTGYAVNTITNGGTLTIDGATIENKSTAQYQIGYAIDNNSTTGDAIINIKAGKVNASGSSYYDGIRLFCNSMTKKNDVIVSGGEVSTIWMQNPSDGAEKNTKDVAGNVEISGGKVGVLSLEPSANFEAAVTGGHIGEISYFQTAEGRDLVQFVIGGSFDNDVNQFCALGYQAVETDGLYTVKYTGKVAEFTIVDGQYTDFNIETPIEVGTLTYTRTIYEGWNALYVPFEIPVNELANDFEVAYINDMHWVDKNDDFTMQTSEMTMEVIKIKNGTLKANHPYIIRPKNGGNIAMNLVLNNVILHKTSEKVDVEFSSAYVEYKVSGTYTKAGVDILNNGNDIYIVSGDNFGVMNNAYPLPAFRIFMTVENKGGSPVIIDQSAPIRIRVAGEKDEATGIITPIIEGDVHVNDGTVYDLMGRPVRTPEKGKIYIMNGKKVLF